MNRLKDKSKDIQREVDDELTRLLKQIYSKKSALRKILKLIPDKNEKDHSHRKIDN